VAEYFRRIGETLDVVKWQPLHYVAAGERVAVFGSMSLRTKAWANRPRFAVGP
jgi:hypothetical protein